RRDEEELAPRSELAVALEQARRQRFGPLVDAHRDTTVTPTVPPAPITWLMPTAAPSTCRAPPRPRSCVTSSCIIPRPDAPNGSPFDWRPPDTLTGIEPPSAVAPERSSFASSPGGHRPSSR